MVNLKHLDISYNELYYLPSAILDLRLDVLDITAHTTMHLKPPEQKRSRDVCSLQEFAAAAVMNYRINTDPLSPLQRKMLSTLTARCRCDNGGYTYCPASAAVETFVVMNIGSVAQTVISQGLSYPATIRILKSRWSESRKRSYRIRTFHFIIFISLLFAWECACITVVLFTA
ncbi:unnamed protein product [Gongylonema pulchrum]|uniref:Uncharacterized protein n=1 Tax=Gongylonema pulchrum TaxID=637853 RepID=A0A3P7RVQ3_9BILA|nr:unnamed protein product [Gongylonema pulchrum]